MRHGLISLVLFALAASGTARGQSAATARPPIAVLGITSEIAAVERRLVNSREIQVPGVIVHRGTLAGRPVVAGRTGTGKVYATIAATAIIQHVKPEILLFSGTGGAVDPGLLLGDVVIGATVAHHDIGQQTPDGLRRRGPRHPGSGELEPVLLPAPAELVEAARRAAAAVTLSRMPGAAAERAPRVVEGVVVTGEMFVAHTSQREELRGSLRASAVEMEGAAVVQTCRYFAVRCLVIRSITDRADGRATTSYQALRTAASENAAAVVEGIVAQLDPKP